MLEGTAVSGPVSASDDQFRHHCENHSPGSFPHPDGDVSRQVSWLALPRLSHLPRLFTAQWRSGKPPRSQLREQLRLGRRPPFRIPF